MSLTFITGNQHKADNLSRLLGIPILHQKIDLDEIQSADLELIVNHKVRQAYEIVQGPVIVDDVALGFEALSGLPGPFIKFFVEQTDGLEKLCRMLDGFEDRSAIGYATIGYFDGDNLRIFSGHIDGKIAQHPRGENGYGWDKIFIPDGFGQRTRAELDATEYDEVYQQIRPVAALRDFMMKLSR